MSVFARRRLSVGLALGLSLAVHGLFVVALCLFPSRRAEPVRMAVETCVLALDGPEQIRAATMKLPTPADGAEEAGDFQPVVLEPPPLVAISRPKQTPPGAGVPQEVGGLPSTGTAGAIASEAHNGAGTAVTPAGPAMFDAVAPGQRVVYLLDRSISMGFRHALDSARRELIAHLKTLPTSATFQVIAYNRHAEPIYLDNRLGMLAGDEATIAHVAHFLGKLPPSGSTDHSRALHRALSLRPDVVYLVTDADDLTREAVQAVTRANGGQSAIHTIELAGRRLPRGDSPLRLLANANRGVHRSVTLAD